MHLSRTSTKTIAYPKDVIRQRLNKVYLSQIKSTWTHSEVLFSSFLPLHSLKTPVLSRTSSSEHFQCLGNQTIYSKAKHVWLIIEKGEMKNKTKKVFFFSCFASSFEPLFFPFGEHFPTRFVVCIQSMKKYHDCSFYFSRHEYRSRHNQNYHAKQKLIPSNFRNMHNKSFLGIYSFLSFFFFALIFLFYVLLKCSFCPYY